MKIDIIEQAERERVEQRIADSGNQWENFVIEIACRLSRIEQRLDKLEQEKE